MRRIATAAVCFSMAAAGQPEKDEIVRIGSEVSWTSQDLARVAIDNVLNDFHAAAAKADFDRYFKAWTDASVFLGTDATERWVGDEFKQFARPHFDSGKGWAYIPHDRTVTFLPDGTGAFFDELLDNSKLGLCRGSGVLRKDDRGDWKILQYNLSIPVPNGLAERIVGLIKAGVPEPPRGEVKHRE